MRRVTFIISVVAVAVLSAAGCKPPEPSEPPTTAKAPSPPPAAEPLEADEVSITWFGQSCFVLRSGGPNIVIDPFDPKKTGYRDPGLRATEVDVMLITHDHFDHNYTKLVKSATQTIRGPGSHEAGAITVTGISSSHGPEGGGTPNTIFAWHLGGIKFCHLGDLGELLSQEQISQIGPVDVLFIPVGGHYTIDAAQATEIVEALKPKIAIPMHYRTPALASGIADVLAPVDDFLEGKEKHPDSRKHTVMLKKDALPETTQVLVMAYE